MRKESEKGYLNDGQLNIKKLQIINVILFFLIILVCGLIMSRIILKNQKGMSVEYNYNTASYSFENYDKGFLDSKYFSYETGFENDSEQKYKLINNYEEYLETLKMIDTWSENSVALGIQDSVPSGIQNYIKEREKILKEAFKAEYYSEQYFDEYSLLLIEDETLGQVLHEISIEDVCIDDEILNVYVKKRAGGSVGGGDGTLFLVSLKKDDIKNVKNIKINVMYTNTSQPGIAYKPVIYLYPTEETEVTVKVGKPENLTHTYPKYENEWKVIAKPNGDLKDVETGRNLYCLYWEGINTKEPTMEEGFIVQGKDTISFLEEKLEILGLNEREANEFIIYWLPKLESNKYNYIRFQTIEEIDEGMPLEINPEPDSIIRILMEYKALEEPIEIAEQKLITPEREGFTVVEWGGTEIK